MRTPDKKKRRGSLFTLLLGNYIAFTLLIVLILTVLFGVFLYRLENRVLDVPLSEIKNYKTLLAEERYSEFPSVRLMGKGSAIAVVDGDGKALYNPRKLRISFSPAQILRIPKYLESRDLGVSKVKTAVGKWNYQVQIYRDNSAELDQVYLFDENYHLLYHSGSRVTGDLSRKEFELFTGSYYSKYNLSRYAFKTKAGESRTLLLLRRSDADSSAMDQADKYVIACEILFVLLYCILILGFIFWLRKKITKPLNLLCDTINRYEVGAETQADYRGPREFQEIFFSFSVMAERLKKSEEERARLEENRRQMLAGIAHDLKTPITVVQGYAQALRDGVIPPEEQLKYLDIIDRKATGLNELINAFYDYSKTEHPDYHLVPECTDICNYLRDYVADRYAELETSGFKIKTEIPEAHVTCMIDRVQFRRVLENVVNNSVRYNAPGTALYFGVNAGKNMVGLLLGDNGIGIPEEVGSRIFEPFVVGEESRSRQGSGLGLSVARRIVELHGGTLTLLRDSPLKAAFYIVLPAEAE